MHRRLFLQLTAVSAGSLALPNIAVAKTPITTMKLPSKLKNNPLLNFDGLPDYTAVNSKHVVPAINFLIKHNRQTVEQLSRQPSIDWQNFYLPLQESSNRLERAWSIVSHLHAVKNSDPLRTAYNTAKEMLTEYSTWYGMYRPLYDGFVALKNSPTYPTYTQEQKQAIDNALLDFELSGIALQAPDAERYGKIVARLSKLSTDFSNNVLDATMGWELVIEDKDKLAGLPESALAAARQSAKDKGKSGYRISLDYPSYAAIMTHADDRQLRKTVFEAYRTRAADTGPNAGKWDNSAIMNEIVELRLQLARLLGFDSYADYALKRRMAENPQQVLDFLGNLLNHARPKARLEMQSLEQFGKQLGVIDELQAWDTLYLSEKQKQSQYNIDKEALRVYFPVPKVLEGLFETARRVFGITIKPKTGVSVWHPSVQFFELYKDNAHIASFYLDLYAREHKRGGAWMSGVIDRKLNPDGSVQLPVAQLVCNFGEGVDGKPALLLHDEVETLFHEFGHGLHHMLTTVNVMAVSGINGVAWDAVEFPSQLMENWTWDKEGLALISAHYQTGVPIPSDMLGNMLAAKNYLAASGMVRQLELGLFDFRLHSEYRAGDDTAIARLRETLKQDVAVIHEPSWTRMAHSFSHIFAGGYAAGYYSYLWADVLASDAFARFASEGIFNQAVGQAYLDAFLAQGGSRPPMQMFVEFMGRKPDPTALLRRQGIV